MDDQKPEIVKKPESLVNADLMHEGVNDETQKMINTPQVDPTGIDDTDAEYIEKVIKMIEAKKIDPHVPSTLLNMPVYEKLGEEAKSAVDINGFNLLAEIRQIKKLWDLGDKGSFQIQNLVHRMRLTKQKIEKEYGNCYII
jgi:hexokinase